MLKHEKKDETKSTVANLPQLTDKLEARVRNTDRVSCGLLLSGPGTKLTEMRLQISKLGQPANFLEKILNYL